MCIVKVLFEYSLGISLSLECTPFPDQLWRICVEFGKSGTNFDNFFRRIMPERPPKCRTAEIACTISELP